jgi:hypothetical protein
MPKRIAFVEAEINRRLSAAVAADSPNRITAGELRGWAREYLAGFDLDLATWPEYADEPHWTLWMNGGVDQDALFVVLIFRPEGIEFFCGTGESSQVLAYEEAIQSADQAFDVMNDPFQVPQPPLHIDRRAAALWLGRGWKP